MMLWALSWHKKEVVSKLVLWQPQHRQTKRGRPKTTYIHTLLEEAGFTTIGELKTAVLDQSDWRREGESMLSELMRDQTN